MKSENGRRRWAGALRAGRAAAFLTLATGINGTVAALEPRYEPIYVYLIAVVVVAWLGGVLLGVTTAVAAVVLYDWMFGPTGGTLSISSVVPFVVAIGAAVVTRLARTPLEKRSFPATPERPLLDVPTVVSITPSIDTRELDDLRAQLAVAGRELDESRRSAENEARLRIEATSSARARLAGLQHELEASRRDAIEQAKRAAALQTQIQQFSTRDGTASDREDALQRELAESRARLGELEQKLRETTEELEVAWSRVDEQRKRADGEAKRLSDLERKANAALQNITSSLAAKYQQPLAEAKKSLGDAIARIALVEKERDEARRLAAVTEERAERERNARDDADALSREKMRLALEEAKKREEAVRAELTAQMAAAEARSNAGRDEMAAEFDRRLEQIVAGITTDYEESLGQATIDREAARAELRTLTKKTEALQKRIAEYDQFQSALSARLETAEKRAAELEESLGVARNELDAARTRLEIEIAERERVERDRDGKIESIVAGLTSDYETSLGESMIEKEAARAQVRELTSRVADLEEKLAEQKVLKARIDQSADVAEKLQAAETRAASLEQSLSLVREELESARTRLEEQTALAGRAREDALRDRNDRLTDYASKVMESELRAAALQQEIERMKSELDDARTKAEVERSQRERSAADFDRKISSIVAGITEDHEHALGEAVVEREAARAEARSLTKKLEGMQRKLMEFDSLHAQVERSTAELRKTVETERARAEEEKRKREKAEAEWAEKLNAIVAHLATDHEADLGQAMLQREEARAEARDLANKLKALQRRVEEQQFRETSSAATPHSAVILVVHSDAGTRAMTKHALELSGYKVTTAADGLEGLRVAAAQRPDVVVAEAVMPKMNGRELVQLLKARPETARTKVVLISGPAASSSDRSSDFRADEVLETPSDFAAMRAALANLLAK